MEGHLLVLLNLGLVHAQNQIERGGHSMRTGMRMTDQAAWTVSAEKVESQFVEGGQEEYLVHLVYQDYHSE